MPTSNLSHRSLPALAFVVTALGYASHSYAQASSCPGYIAPTLNASSTTFGMDLIYGTDTYENASGSVLFTTHDLYAQYGMSPTLACIIDGDTSISLPTYVTANLYRLIGSTTDYEFLTNPDTPSVLLTSSGGLVYNIAGGSPPPSTKPPPFGSGNPPPMMVTDLESMPFDGSIVSNILSYDDADSDIDSFYATNGTDYEDGSVAVNVFDLNIVEQEPASVPEPSALSLFLAGLAFVLLGRFWRPRSVA